MGSVYPGLFTLRQSPRLTDRFPLHLKVTRVVRGLKQSDVAELASVSQPDVSAAERGQRVPPERLARMASALGIDPPQTDSVR